MSLPAKWRLGVFAVLALLVLSAQAEPIASLKPTGYVNDFAHVLDQNTIAQMDEICRQIDEKAHAQIAVVTVHSLDGSDIESYAVDLFHQWGVGSKSNNRGVLILYAIDDHRARIEVGYGLEPILTDGKVGAIPARSGPAHASGNYSQALLLVTTRVAKSSRRTPEFSSRPATRTGSGPAERAAGQGMSAGGILLADCHRTDRSFYAASQPSFSGCCFPECLAAAAGAAEVGAEADLVGGGGFGGVVALADLAAAVRAAAGAALVAARQQ